MQPNENGREDSWDRLIGDVARAATALAARATENAGELAAQAVRDARRVADSFETLVEAGAREGLERARDAIDAAWSAAERAWDRFDETPERARAHRDERPERAWSRREEPNARPAGGERSRSTDA